MENQFHTQVTQEEQMNQNEEPGYGSRQVQRQQYQFYPSNQQNLIQQKLQITNNSKQMQQSQSSFKDNFGHSSSQRNYDRSQVYKKENSEQELFSNLYSSIDKKIYKQIQTQEPQSTVFNRLFQESGLRKIQKESLNQYNPYKAQQEQQKHNLSAYDAQRLDGHIIRRHREAQEMINKLRQEKEERVFNQMQQQPTILENSKKLVEQRLLQQGINYTSEIKLKKQQRLEQELRKKQNFSFTPQINEKSRKIVERIEQIKSRELELKMLSNQQCKNSKQNLPGQRSFQILDTQRIDQSAQNFIYENQRMEKQDDAQTPIQSDKKNEDINFNMTESSLNNSLQMQNHSPQNQRMKGERSQLKSQSQYQSPRNDQPDFQQSQQVYLKALQLHYPGALMPSYSQENQEIPLCYVNLKQNLSVPPAVVDRFTKSDQGKIQFSRNPPLGINDKLSQEALKKAVENRQILQYQHEQQHYLEQQYSHLRPCHGQNKHSVNDYTLRVAERNNKWLEQKNSQIQKQKQIQEQMVDQHCTFKPQLSPFVNRMSRENFSPQNYQILQNSPGQKSLNRSYSDSLVRQSSQSCKPQKTPKNSNQSLKAYLPAKPIQSRVQMLNQLYQRTQDKRTFQQMQQSNASSLSYRSSRPGNQSPIHQNQSRRENSMQSRPQSASIQDKKQDNYKQQNKIQNQSGDQQLRNLYQKQLNKNRSESNKNRTINTGSNVLLSQHYCQLSPQIKRYSFAEGFDRRRILENVQNAQKQGSKY